MYRRTLLAGAGGLLGSGLATRGRGAIEVTQDDAEAAAEAVVGDLVEGDQLHLVVEAVGTTTALDEFTEADDGNEFLVVRLAYQNVSDEVHSVSGWLQTRVRDDDDYSYDQSLSGTGAALDDGEIVPGEVQRGELVYEVPEDAAGFILEFDFELGLFGDLERATIDLERDRDEPHVLEQDLAIDVYDVGDAIEYEGTTVIVNEVNTTTALDEFTEADDDHEYVIVDVTVANETGEEQHVSTLLQMQLKDGSGFSYSEDLGATAALDRVFDEGAPLADGDQRRGQLAYEVEADLEPLYWVFEFALLNQGDKTFWQLR